MTDKKNTPFPIPLVFVFLAAVGFSTCGGMFVGRDMVDCEECPEPSSTPIAAASTSASPPPPTASTSPPAPEPEPWRYVSDPSELLGTWLATELGAPTKDGKIVKGGIEMTFEARGSTSKTPFNVRFMAPDEGHMSSETISGGCGFYPPETSEDMTAFCRGYGLDAEAKALRTSITIERRGDALKFEIDGLLSGELTKVGE